MVVDMVFVLVLVDKVHTANMEMVTIDRIIASIADSDIIADIDILVSHINIEGVVNVVFAVDICPGGVGVLC